jgi:hypothetical protein
MHEHHEHATMTFGVLKKNILRQCITPQSIIMPTKRKGASKHRQSRRSRRHSRRNVRGAGKFKDFKESIKSGLYNISNMFKKKSTMTLEPYQNITRVSDETFTLIGKYADSKMHTDLLKYTGMKDGNHYMPGGFVYWGGNPEASKPDGWYQVKKFDPTTNMPIGRAYHVRSPENPVMIKDARGDYDFEVF